MSLKKMASVIFHRTVLVAVLLVVQVGLLAAMVIRFSDYFVQFYLFCVVISVLAVLHVINSKGDPGYKIAWLVPILLVPVFGGLVYLLCGGNRLSPRVQRKMEGMDHRLMEVLDQDRKAEALAPFGRDAVNQSLLSGGVRPSAPSTPTPTPNITLWGTTPSSPCWRNCAKAEKYIFLEYFIIAPGKFWDSVLEILEEKVSQGVDVRVIYDDVDSLFTLPKKL